VSSGVWKETSNWRVLGEVFMLSCKAPVPVEVVRVPFLYQAILELK